MFDAKTPVSASPDAAADGVARPEWPALLDPARPRFWTPTACALPANVERLATPASAVSDESSFYLRQRGRGIVRLPRAGGTATSVFAHEFVRWFGRVGTSLFVLTDNDGLPRDLWTVSTAGGTPRRLLTVDEGFVEVVLPLSDGIYYSVWRVDSSNLRRLSLDGAEDMWIADDARSGVVVADDRFLYVVRTTGDDHSVHAVTRPFPGVAASSRLLWTGHSSEAPTAMLVDERFVYLLAGNDVLQLPKEGGSAKTLATISLSTQRTLAQDDRYIYFEDAPVGIFNIPTDARVRAVPKTGGLPFDVAAFFRLDALFVDRGALYLGLDGVGIGRVPITWTDCDDGSRVDRWPLPASVPSRVPEPIRPLPPPRVVIAETRANGDLDVTETGVSLLGTSSAVVSRTTGLQIAAPPPAPLTHEVVLGGSRYRIDQGSVLRNEQRIGTAHGSRAVAFDEEAIYWFEAAEHTMKLRRQSGTGAVSTVVERPLRERVALAADGKNLWWIENELRYALYRVSTAGGQPELLLEDAGPAVTAIAVHKGDVFWMRGSDPDFLSPTAFVAQGAFWVLRRSGAEIAAVQLSPDVPVVDFTAGPAGLFFSSPGPTSQRFAEQTALFLLPRWW